MEKRTNIWFDETSNNMAFVSTFNNRLKKSLADLEKKRPSDVQVYREWIDGEIEYKFPKEWIKIAPPKKLQLTDEQRNDRRARMKNIRSRKYSN